MNNNASNWGFSLPDAETKPKSTLFSNWGNTVETPTTGSFFGDQPLVPNAAVPDTGFNLNFGDVSKGLSGLGGLLQGWAGIKGIKLGEDQLRFQKALANRNLENQAQTVNTELGDRQQRRISASGEDNYQAVDEYVKQHGVRGGAL